MAQPWRIFHDQLMEFDEDGIVCRKTGDNRTALAAAIIGCLGCLVYTFAPVGEAAFQLTFVFVLFPSIGLIFTSAVLWKYRELKIIFFKDHTIILHQRLFNIPMKKERWNTDDFATLDVWVRDPGRENKPGRYYTIALTGGERDIPLIDLDDYDNAKKTARELREFLWPEEPTGADDSP